MAITNERLPHQALASWQYEEAPSNRTGHLATRLTSCGQIQQSHKNGDTRISGSTGILRDLKISASVPMS
ncbi:hypothetical protein LguiA_026089 [Lonicera macranthoides]